MMVTRILISLTCLSMAPSDASGPRVSLRTLNAEDFQATLLRMSSDSIEVLVDGGSRIIAMEDALQLRPIRLDDSTVDSPRPNVVTCFLVDGGRITGDVLDSDSSGAVRLGAGKSFSIDLPFNTIAAIRFGSVDDKAMLDDFNARRADRKPGRDLLLLARGGRETAVPGALERLAPEGWAFRFGSKTRNGGFSSAFGVILGSPAPRREARATALEFVDGNLLFGNIDSADDAHLVFRVGTLQALKIPWTMVRAIRFDSGRVIRLSELTPTGVSTTSVIGGDWPAAKNTNVTGGPLRIGSRTYADGWGVHATSRLEFDLGGAYERFVSDVGVDTSVGTCGSVIFRVIADGATLFETDVMRGGQAARRIKVELGKAKHLILECDRADGLDLSDHADWAQAYLVRRKGAEAS